ncbi:cupredoxin domain-containing protein [Frankia sp. Cppng1_Ct_nod]|uniref:cupredoxin domain-containing protein n=1 Tax=Frankia sp. Cppng1_Ct_nod TaxID=2897162 RepID=UPI002024DD13|nr:cupredoxin domain-containing protein [Frankia sp. Cppng1_Ct_nod]
MSAHAGDTVSPVGNGPEATMNAMTCPGTTRRLRAGGDRPRRHGKAIIAALAVIFAVLGLAGCGSSAPTSSSTVVTSATPKIENGVQVFNVVGTAALKFSPSTLIAGPGKITVNLTVESGSPPHNLVVESISGARTDFASVDRPRSVTFTVDKPGNYRFVCTIHPSMQGTLTIS